jgi:hypothetical protein
MPQSPAPAAVVPVPTAGIARLPESALPYWRTVVAEAEQANRELEEAARLEQQVARLRQSATARLGAYEGYFRHVCETLGLDPQQAAIEPDGRVVRGVPTPTANGTADATP